MPSLRVIQFLFAILLSSIVTSALAETPVVMRVIHNLPELLSDQGQERLNASYRADHICNTLAQDHFIESIPGAFDPKELWIFQARIAPLLSQVDARLPNFGKALRRALNKRWKFEDSDFKDCSFEEAFSPDLDHVLACQKPEEIRVNSKWFGQLENKFCKKLGVNGFLTLVNQQKDFFLRMLLLGITQGTSISAESSEEILTLLSQNSLPDSSTLELQLEISGFGMYGITAAPCNPNVPASILSETSSRNIRDTSAAAHFILSQSDLEPCSKALHLAERVCKDEASVCSTARDTATRLCGSQSITSKKALPE